VKVVVSADAVELVEADDTKRFHVEVREDADVAAVLDTSGAGTLADDGEHAFIDIGWVRTNAVAVGPQWDQEFGAMLDFARSKGWVDEGSSSIRAHLERA
jgi:hypothetical protein